MNRSPPCRTSYLWNSRTAVDLKLANSKSGKRRGLVWDEKFLCRVFDLCRRHLNEAIGMNDLCGTASVIDLGGMMSSRFERAINGSLLSACIPDILAIFKIKWVVMLRRQCCKSNCVGLRSIQQAELLHSHLESPRVLMFTCVECYNWNSTTSFQKIPTDF